MNPMPHLHLSKRHVMRLAAPPEKVFPLLCPVREHEWLEGWEAQMVHAPSGHAEPRAVFTTPGHGTEPWIWTISRHDPASGDIQFVVHAPGSHVTILDIQLAPEGEGSLVSWTYSLTALSPSGEAFARGYMDRFSPRMEGLETRLGHFLRTGSMKVSA